MPIEQFCTRELQEMKEVCEYVCGQKNQGLIGDIYLLALLQIRGELDVRKIRKEGGK